MLKSGGGDPKPPNWGDDRLSAFLEHAYKNRWATFVQKPKEFQLLGNIDQCFEDALKDWTNPTHPVAAHLYLRSHAAFRAACEHAAAGQVAEVFPMVRIALEYAGYALHIAKTPGLEDVWLRRHDNDAALGKAKAEFLVSKVRTTIASANRKAAQVFDLLYQQAIDMGAHPNERAVTGNMAIVDYEGGQEWRQVYLHGDGIQIDLALKVVARAGVCILEISQEAFPARFELLGVRYKILELRKGL